MNVCILWSTDCIEEKSGGGVGWVQKEHWRKGGAEGGPRGLLSRLSKHYLHLLGLSITSAEGPHNGDNKNGEDIQS